MNKPSITRAAYELGRKSIEREYLERLAAWEKVYAIFPARTSRPRAPQSQPPAPNKEAAAAVPAPVPAPVSKRREKHDAIVKVLKSFGKAGPWTLAKVLPSMPKGTRTGRLYEIIRVLIADGKIKQLNRGTRYIPARYMNL